MEKKLLLLVASIDLLEKEEVKKLEACVSWVTGCYPGMKKMYLPKPIDHNKFVERNGFDGVSFIKKTTKKLQKGK